MRELGYTSINRIFSKVSRDLGVDEFSETDVVEWCGEALEAIGAIDMLEEAVYFAEVKNHQVQLPPFMDSIIQIAKFNDLNGNYKEEYTPEKICDVVLPDNPYDNCEGCSEGIHYIPVDEGNNPIFDTDRAEWRPNINVQVEYINWRDNGHFRSAWTPVRLKNHTFFNSIVCAEDNSEGLYNSCKDEYTIVGNKVLRVSFQEGYVAIAHTRQMLDDDGYPMIPDHFSYTTAITKYVTLRLMERFYYMGRQGYEGKVQKADQDWHWYCKQAGNRAIMPSTVDEFENLLRQSQYLLPRQHRYNEFFGGLSNEEIRTYNDPNGRNRTR